MDTPRPEGNQRKSAVFNDSRLQHENLTTRLGYVMQDIDIYIVIMVHPTGFEPVAPRLGI